MLRTLNHCVCAWTGLPEFQKLPVSLFDRENRGPEAMLLFQTEFQCSGTVRLRFSAGCRFRLFLNGTFLEDGPVEVGGDYGCTTPPDWWFFDEYTLNDLPENNTVRMEVFPAGITQTDYSDGSGWIFLELEQNGVKTSFPAEKWKCRRNSGYLSNQLYDFSLENESDPWLPCVPVPERTLTQLELPHLTNDFQPFSKAVFPYGETSVRVQSDGSHFMIQAGDPAVFYLEFPEEITAHFQFTVEGDAGASVEFNFQEKMGVPSEDTVQFLLDGGKRTFRCVKMTPFRWVRVFVTPSGFASPENPQPVLLSGLGGFRRNFPLGEAVPLPPDPPEWLALIDRQCLANLKLCMQRMHLDSPVHQEGLGCVGDYRIEALIEYAVYGESRLAKADLIRIAFQLRRNGKLFHTSYELSYLMMLAEYAQFTGDLELPRELFDTVEKTVSRFESFLGPEGLVSESDNYCFIDWKVEGGFSYHHPPAERGMGAMTALFAGSLEKTAELSLMLGKNEFAESCSKRIELLRTAFNKQLWDLEKKCYRDGIPNRTRRQPGPWLPADAGKNSWTSQTNILALAYGMVPCSGTALDLMERMVFDRTFLQPTPYFMQYFFEAVDRYAQWDCFGLILLGRWQAFADGGLRETWLAGDYSHAWGACPSFFMRIPHKTDASL